MHNGSKLNHWVTIAALHKLPWLPQVQSSVFWLIWRPNTQERTHAWSWNPRQSYIVTSSNEEVTTAILLNIYYVLVNCFLDTYFFLLTFFNDCWLPVKQLRIQDCVCDIVEQCSVMKMKENIQIYSKGWLQDLGHNSEKEGRMQEPQIRVKCSVAVSSKWKHSFLEVGEEL